MTFLIIGVTLLLGLFLSVYLGLKHRYTATEGLLALVVFEIFFLGIALTVYGFLLTFK